VFTAKIEVAAIHDRHLNSRDISKENRVAALTEWRQLVA